MNEFERKYYEDDTFWNQSLTDPANQNRISQTFKIIPTDVRSIADIGCGNGVFLNYVERRNPSIDLIGVDRSEAALKYLTVQSRIGSIENIPLKDREYDCVTCLEVLEHLPVSIYNRSLHELCRVADRYIIVSVPNEEDLQASFTQCPQCKSRFSYEMHLRSYSKRDVPSLLDDYGFKCISVSTLGNYTWLIGQTLFRKWLYPEQQRVFHSPICPICGFERDNPRSKSQQVAESHHRLPMKKRVLSMITALPKLLWPKASKDYWILAIYKRRYS